MKRVSEPHPHGWTSARSSTSPEIIDVPVVQDLPSLLWVVNLGCIDLNQWHAQCDDVDRPD
jgi:DNA primase